MKPLPPATSILRVFWSGLPEFFIEILVKTIRDKRIDNILLTDLLSVKLGQIVATYSTFGFSYCLRTIRWKKSWTKGCLDKINSQLFIDSNEYDIIKHCWKPLLFLSSCQQSYLQMYNSVPSNNYCDSFNTSKSKSILLLQRIMINNEMQITEEAESPSGIRCW